MSVAGGEVSAPEAGGENLEKRYPRSLGDAFEVGINTETGAIGFPDSPVIVFSLGASRNDCGSGLRFRSAEITAESIVGRRVAIRQGRVCG